MSGFKQMERAYINWRDDRDLPPKQSTGHDNPPADEEAAGDMEDQAGTTSGRRRGKRGRRRGRSRGKNKNSQETALASQDQAQDTAESPAMATATTPAEREAAAAHFWTNATPTTLFGFPSNAEILAANLANETRNRSTAEPLIHTDQYQEINRPVEEGESPFDPNISQPRSAAILGGFVERREDVGKKRKDWARERYIYAGESDELVVKDKKKNNDHQPTEDQAQDQKELTPNGMKKWEWYGKNLRKDAARDARRTAKGEATERGGKVPSRRVNLHNNGRYRHSPGDDNTGGTGYDHGGFQGTNEIYAEPAHEVKNFNPEAMVFEPDCKLGGSWGPWMRKDEPDGEMEGGLGAPEQVV